MAATANAREVIGEATLGELEGTLRGRLVRPSDPDYEQARSIVRQLLDALPSGSYLVHCDGTTTDASYVKALEDYKQTGGVPYIAREHDQIAAYFEGLELVEPGVVPIHEWRPESGLLGALVAVDESGGVGRKT